MRNRAGVWGGSRVEATTRGDGSDLAREVPVTEARPNPTHEAYALEFYWFLKHKLKH